MYQTRYTMSKKFSELLLAHVEQMEVNGSIKTVFPTSDLFCSDSQSPPSPGIRNEVLSPSHSSQSREKRSQDASYQCYGI